VDVAQAIFLNNRELFVIALAAFGRDDYSSVVAGIQILTRIAIIEESFDHALELPGRSGTGRVVEMPGYVDFEANLGVFGDVALIVGQVHQAGIVVEDSGGRGFNHGHFGAGHYELPPSSALKANCKPILNHLKYKITATEIIQRIISTRSGLSLITSSSGVLP